MTKMQPVSGHAEMQIYVRTYVDYLVNYMIASYTVSALETVTYVHIPEHV